MINRGRGNLRTLKVRGNPRIQAALLEEIELKVSQQKSTPSPKKSASTRGHDQQVAIPSVDAGMVLHEIFGRVQDSLDAAIHLFSDLANPIAASDENAYSTYQRGLGPSSATADAESCDASSEGGEGAERARVVTSSAACLAEKTLLRIKAFFDGSASPSSAAASPEHAKNFASTLSITETH